MAENQRLIDQFQKNSAEAIKIQAHDWDGREYIDVRVFYSEEIPAELETAKPTKKGITLRRELLPRLIEALQKAQAELGAEDAVNFPEEATG